MGVTIKDVAKRVGVTPATVSMVINNKPRISEETRRKVRQAIEELDYFPHEGARSLVLQRTNTLGVAAPFFTSYFVLETLSGIERAVRESDYNLVLYGTRGLAETEEAVVTRIARERKVDGLISINLALKPEQVALFQRNNVRVICLENEAEGCDWVRVDNVSGAREATAHLLGLGHRSVALVTGPTGSVAKQREQGYREALLAAGLRPEDAPRIEAPNYSREDGLEAGARILAAKRRPTAVFVAAGDVCATGVLLAFKRAGVSVPREISLVGFDDQPFAELMEPALTTVRQPMERMGREAFGLLRDALKETRERTPVRRDFETELIVRGSTSRAKA